MLGPEYRQSWDRLARRHSSSDSSTDPATPEGGAQQPPPPPPPQQQHQQQQQQLELQPAEDAPVQALLALAAPLAAAEAAAAEAAPQDGDAVPVLQQMPGSPSSDQSASSQDGVIV